jgi:hypothetical protein
MYSVPPVFQIVNLCKILEATGTIVTLIGRDVFVEMLIERKDWYPVSLCSMYSLL